eukprot:CAMPEP_0181191154 /NCGR_PEP_ID=MMETSP1096-20121128/12582_1 /TAXON_ID=156174 ORGANISM="Chrysochromulina ericina, Strain CCMP281" /NCGR_SAMPLE_ID=MMETSP1096 /ASSEMBLY_ACC=CAM_ASM_000453 /LENGTH=102 /DNA_ID=CAMNT_0023280431 /DNA_START=383 /DNA_END=691 /DNA_ORIENTATION=-
MKRPRARFDSGCTSAFVLRVDSVTAAWKGMPPSGVPRVSMQGRHARSSGALRVFGRIKALACHVHEGPPDQRQKRRLGEPSPLSYELESQRAHCEPEGRAVA